MSICRRSACRCRRIRRGFRWNSTSANTLHPTATLTVLRSSWLCTTASTTGIRLHDETSWQEPLVEYDSWLNRRLAIALRGWGDLVERRGMDPQAIGTLRELEELARWACTTLHSRSRMLACNSNWCPALDEAGARVLRKNASTRWTRRWKRAIRNVAVRHRNLTTMSPWDVFPAGKPADLRYADLLPLTQGGSASCSGTRTTF